MTQDTLGKMVNYLVPASGTTRGYTISRAFDATPYQVNFTTIELDGTPFRPSGVFIDNSQGTEALVIMINEIAYRITCPAGEALQMQFPAPMSMTLSIIGGGQATAIFVDFPVIPFRSTSADSGDGGGAATIANGADVAQGATTDPANNDPFVASSVITLLKGIVFTMRQNNGTDTTGEFLPDNFQSLAQTMLYTVENKLESTSRTDGINTWTQTLTYEGDNLTSVSGWMKS